MARSSTADERFAALGEMKGKLRGHDGKPAPARIASGSPEPGDDEAALFRQSVAGAKKLKADNHAHIDRPRPSSMPRPRAPEPEPETATPHRPRTVLEEAYQDVTPLADRGRVDPSITHRPTRPLPATTPDAPREQAQQPASLFEQAMLGAVPLANTGRLHLSAEPPAAVPRQKERNDREVLRESLEGEISFEDRLEMGDEPAFLRPGIPRRVLSDLRRGRWVLQGQLDLHGMTRDEARTALGNFLVASLKEGKRCLRLIHGKGLGSPGGEPVLKHLSRNWLAQRDEILAFCQARPFDGGAGAVLILLRAGSKPSRPPG